MADVFAMPPTIQEKYQHMRDNADAFVQSMEAMIAAAKRDGNEDLASKLLVWCLLPWRGAIAADDAGDLWWTCEVCGLPIKDDNDRVHSDDGCQFHSACVHA